MSTQVFPSLTGLGWSVRRTPLWKTRRQESISGKRTFITDWSYPRWRWELKYNFLRQAGANMMVTSYSGHTYSEFSQLVGFFNSRQGDFDSFLYTDPNDNTIAGQSIGIGDGSTKIFQLIRTFGGFSEPVLAPNTVTTVYDNGTPVPGANYSISTWGATNPGQITFVTAPLAGHTITADFSYYFPVTFAGGDKIDFEQFMAMLYSAKSVTLESIK